MNEKETRQRPCFSLTAASDLPSSIRPNVLKLWWCFLLQDADGRSVCSYRSRMKRINPGNWCINHLFSYFKSHARKGRTYIIILGCESGQTWRSLRDVRAEIWEQIFSGEHKSSLNVGWTQEICTNNSIWVQAHRWEEQWEQRRPECELEGKYYIWRWNHAAEIKGRAVKQIVNKAHMWLLLEVLITHLLSFVSPVRMTGREFFTRFPTLYPFLLHQLQEAAATVERWDTLPTVPPFHYRFGLNPVEATRCVTILQSVSVHLLDVTRTRWRTRWTVSKSYNHILETKGFLCGATLWNITLSCFL